MKRDEFVDSLRGLFHVLLLIDHLPVVLLGLSSFVSDFFDPLGYTSITEGFVFLSGFVSGIVYTRVSQSRGGRAMWRKVFARARNIYLTYVVAAVFLLVLSRTVPAPAFNWEGSAGLDTLPVLVIGLKILLFLYQPSFLEILPMYCLLLLMTPLLIKQFEESKYKFVLSVSVFVWALAQYGIREKLLSLVPEKLGMSCGYFDFFGWQLLFVMGLMCGHKTFVYKKPWIVNYRLFSVLAYGIALFLLFLRHDLFGVTLHSNNCLVDRSSLGPVRLIDFICICFVAARMRVYFAPYINWSWFRFLSRHSLQVFAFHLYPIYFIALFLKERPSNSPLFQAFLMALCAGSLFLIAFVARRLTACRT